MTARSQTGLWAAAAAGSIALHVAAGMILYAMPMPDGPKTVRTEINIAAVSTGDSQVPIAESVTAASPEGSAIAARPSELAALEVESTAPAPTPGRQSTDARPADQSAEAVAVHAEPALPHAAADTLEPSQAQTAAEPTPARETALGASAAVAASEAPVPSTVAAAIPAAPSASASQSWPPAQAAPIAADELVPALQSDESITVPPLQSSEPTASALQTEAEAIASIESETPQVASGSEAIAPLGGALAAATPTQSAREPAQAPKGEAALAARPAAGAASSPPSASLAPSAAAARASIEPTVARRAADGDASVVAPSGLASPVETEAPVVAALPRPLAPPDIAQPDPPRPPGIGISTFLADHKGGDGDCLLALPAAGAEATQALIKAYAREPGLVGELRAAYERIAGSRLEADIRPVSQEQCIALIFARSLAQYPNFPLGLTLDEEAIRSGESLSGDVSGLRKDTLYLVVVDDEGKAELVTSFAGQSTSLMTFREPMTLTSAPVSSVQLLVAIASDGPLRNVPVSPGMPAEEYFSRLATEIIAGNRSIAFGITSFVVR